MLLPGSETEQSKRAGEGIDVVVGAAFVLAGVLDFVLIVFCDVVAVLQGCRRSSGYFD